MGDRKHRSKMQPPILSPDTTGFTVELANARMQKGARWRALCMIKFIL